MIAEVKGQLRKNGIMPPRGLVAAPVNSTREYRKVPMSRLIARLGLEKYDVPAPVVDVEIKTKKAKIKLGQSIGAPAVACVSVGDNVKFMDVVGTCDPEKLGTPVHAPFDGKVVEVNEQFVVIEA